MSHRDDENLTVLERALIEAYRRRSDASHAVDVTRAVMRDLRGAGDDRRHWASLNVPDQLVWRTATITAAIVLTATVLTVGVFRPSARVHAPLAVDELESVPLFGD